MKKRSFVVEDTEFGMFSDQGNYYVRRLINKIVKMPLCTTESDILWSIKEGRTRIADLGHTEVWDTAVREAIVYALLVYSCGRLEVTL